MIREIGECGSETNWKNWNFLGKFENNPEVNTKLIELIFF